MIELDFCSKFEKNPYKGEAIYSLIWNCRFDCFLLKNSCYFQYRYYYHILVVGIHHRYLQQSLITLILFASLRRTTSKAFVTAMISARLFLVPGDISFAVLAACLLANHTAKDDTHCPFDLTDADPSQKTATHPVSS